MVLKRIYCLLVFIALLCCTLCAAAQEVQDDENNYILILSSYNYENEWATAVAKSIRSEIEKKNSDALVNITYANITGKKSFLGGRLGMQAAFVNARLSATRILPAVLVLIGDEAWMYYRIMNLRGLWESIPVVLVGVNEEILDDYTKFFSDKAILPEDFIPLQETFATFNIKTLVKDSSANRTIDLITKLLPGTNEFYFISEKRCYQDYYLSGKVISYLKKNYPEIQSKVIEHTSENTDSIQEFLRVLPQNAAVLVNTYKMDGNFSAPVFSVRETCLRNNNLIGGYYPATNDYGVQAAEIVLEIFENNSATLPAVNIVKGASVYLNKEALSVRNIKVNVLDTPEVIYVNIPPSFFEKNRRALFISFLIILLITIVIILIVRAGLYRKSLRDSIERYKKLYEEYQIVYENIPMGLLQLDSDGYIYESNPIARKFLKTITNANFEDFNINSSTLFDKDFRLRIQKKEAADEFYSFNGYTYRIIVKYLEDSPERKDNILIILIDITEIQYEKKLKEEVYSIFNFAINASSLGLSEYNLLDGNGFATDAWYKNWGVGSSNGFQNLCSRAIPEDKEKIHNYLRKIKEGQKDIFLDTICIEINEEKHWLRYIMKPMEYAPEKGRIIVAGMVLNFDKQMKHEAELADAIIRASESDRLKNSFIANMSNEIRPCLEELISCSTEMTEATDKIRKMELLELIEKDNEILLKYIQDIIHLSQAENNNIKVS